MKQYVKSTLTNTVNPKDLSKERLETLVSFTVDILSDCDTSTSDQLLRILKLYGHYDLI